MVCILRTDGKNGSDREMEILGLITARAGSKGVTRKNMAEVGGKPLVAWTVEAALAADDSPHIDVVLHAIRWLEDFVPAPRGYPRRQDLPPAYALNGAIFLARCGMLLAEGSWYAGHTYPYMMPPERSLDIDTPLDVLLADLIMGVRVTP